MSNILDIWLVAHYSLAIYAAHELKDAVRKRRMEIGLSQTALARLSGLSRATISQVEGGTINDLSFSRTAAMLNVLGLGLTITPAHPRLRVKDGDYDPIAVAARSASTSYARLLPPEALVEVLRTGRMLRDFEPHIAALLDEAPLALLAKVVEQIHTDWTMPREQIWATMRKLATQSMTTRPIWTA